MGVFKLLSLLLLIEVTLAHFHGGHRHLLHYPYNRPQPVVQNSPPAQAEYYIAEPWYPKSIPYAPGGNSECPQCGWISVVKCRATRSKGRQCVEPVVKYTSRQCGVRAEIQCAASGYNVTLENLSGTQWRNTAQSMSAVSEKFIDYFVKTDDHYHLHA
ncbi:hypothetical protein Y032_0001g286 [Ancylostoma ceylanicum]|uniref:Uncharacterized protein n=1 Tax=Ancylostoma ceylanicum TaxID=53326 RepID=A0A016W3L0_9BILA|nr:hypothetical protein Y032_0001g286 [Ancylostoma ceylanicum]